ncbi:hypothetical protein PVAND_000487 [Polypedilum vanderplanki]|uniref:Uncharacterized protein n=1 Tax=Polypedilum vanderplanki TaxID=319348 RepID=A0A9J6BJZ2_POLVA|nr:hypothetical protein PVAND_000487 [Polypedilum vanderplanki]
MDGFYESNFFINIKAITIFDSTFKEFNGDELDEFPQLKFLSIVNSKLTTIPSSLFKNTPNIILVDFYNALIEQVGFYLFSSIDIAQLKWFVFLKNPCIDRGVTNSNQTEIISIIKELQENCPLIGEEITTTTEKENLLTCSDKNIEELVCDLKDDIEEIFENLSTKDKRIEKVESNFNERNEILEKELIKIREEMQAKDKEIQEMRLEFQSRISWLEEEILKMTTNPCACK